MEYNYIVASFLSLRLEVNLQRRMEEKGIKAPWPDLMRDLKRLQAVRIKLEGLATSVARTWRILPRKPF